MGNRPCSVKTETVETIYIIKRTPFIRSKCPYNRFERILTSYKRCEMSSVVRKLE